MIGCSGWKPTSPVALNVPLHFDRLLAGDSAVEVVDDPIYRNYSPFLRARIRDFDRRELIPDRMLRKLLSRSPAFALPAGTEAIRDAGIGAGELQDCGSICPDADPESFIPALRESIDTNGSIHARDEACRSAVSRQISVQRGALLALSDGAAFLMLETLDHARKRSASVYGELLGFGETAAPASILQPSADGEALALAAKRAIETSGSSGRIDLLLGSGRAIEIDDTREAQACAGLFPDATVPFSAFTGALGFLGAATGTFSVVYAMLAIRRGVLPPTINCDEPVVTSSLDLVRQTRAAVVRRVLVWASDRGIKNASIVVGVCDGDVP
jgi:3-oxoacyl-(acyl-carrier-protein) synthase